MQMMQASMRSKMIFHNGVLAGNLIRSLVLEKLKGDPFK